MSNQQPPPSLSSYIVKNRWKIQNKLGQGSFGEIYAAIDLQTGEDVAIKIERIDKNENKRKVLKQETNAIRRLQGCPYVVRYISAGRAEEFHFLIMERLGDSLADIKRKVHAQIFSLTTTARLGIQMLDAVEGIHKLGYIHRDIKPSNFVMGRDPSKLDKCYVIDFGLAKRYVMPSGEVRPIAKSGFRGTARYASINSHHCLELGRRDDLWCIFYLLVEFAIGHLPWQKLKDKKVICDLKEKYTSPHLVRDLPNEFLQFMDHLKKLKYEDEPDYAYLKSLMHQVFVKAGGNSETTLDWLGNNRQIRTDVLPNGSESPTMASISGFHNTSKIKETNSTGSRFSASAHSIPSQERTTGVVQAGNKQVEIIMNPNMDERSDKDNKTKCKCIVM